MAFDARQLEHIRALLDPFCAAHSPEEHRDQLRMTYSIDGHAVTLFEERPDWRGSGEWMRSEIARFRYYRSRDEWQLYWMRADMKWHLYEPAAPVFVHRKVDHFDHRKVDHPKLVYFRGFVSRPALSRNR